MAGNGNRQLTYSIKISADTLSFTQAMKHAIESLEEVSKRPSATTRELQNAAIAAQNLATNLRRAFNENTGKLDLISLDQSLQRSNMTLRDYQAQLSKLGDTGRNAFLNTVQAISRAEQPLMRTNKLMSDLWITMKNTMRWQITTSVLHGFVGSLQSAYGYSKNLDSSLNSIRIVTQKSTEDMRDFAKQANEAAKALSTTTVDYTDASLIYYQQGLEGKDVTDRTDTTIKLANVSRETAETASQQLTAIWNNFYDGSKALEYYADVMVALGASTASSSDEIAEGIQKFAAVANTVGLSYEYAASALATLTANTRENADVIGNALKTLFARIQGLKLGETLEDGTDFNKYSKALEAVGVNIKQVNGELKGMDQILDETAAKWTTLSKDSQIALAQTVAGVRQYNQFVALMDNWGDFQKNLQTATNATGELQKQADIYADSWEAARNRVKASAEDIYDSLINPDFYIKTDNMISPMLTGIANVIDGLGGMQGVLAGVAVLMNKVYGDRISESLNNLAINLSLVNDKENERTRILREQSGQILQNLLNSQGLEEVDRMRIDSLARYNSLQQQIGQYMDQLTPRQRVILQQDLDQIEAIQNQINGYAILAQESQDTYQTMADNMINGIRAVDNWIDRIEQLRLNLTTLNANTPTIPVQIDTTSAVAALGNLLAHLEQITIASSTLHYIRDRLNELPQGAQVVSQELFNMAQQFNLISKSANITDNDVQTFFNDVRNGRGALQDIDNASRLLRETLNSTFSNVRNGSIDRYVRAINTSENATRSLSQASDLAADEINRVTTGMQNGSYAAANWSENLITLGSNLSKITMGLNSINSLIDVMTDKDASIGDKITRGLSSATGIIFMFSAALKKATPAIAGAGAAAGTAGAAAGAGAAGFAGLGTAITGAAAAAAPWLVVGAVVIGVISGITKAIDKNKKARIEELEAAQENRKETLKEIDTNEELLRSYNQLLETYKSTGEGKSELESSAQALIDAYGVEYSALGKLSEGYREYSGVIDSVQKKRQESLKEGLKLAQENAQDAVDVLGIDGLGFSVNTSGYDKGRQILNQYVKSTSTNSISFKEYSPDSVEEIGAFYDNLLKAKQAMEDTMTTQQLESSKAYQDVIKYLDTMEEKILNYRDAMSSVLTYQAKLGMLSTQTDTQITSYQEYIKWVDELNDSFIEAGKSEDEIKTILDSIVDSSSNLNIQKFRDIANALNEARELVSDKDWDLEKIFNNKLYDTSILTLIDWRIVTEESFNEAYERAKKYKEAIDQVTESTKTLKGIAEAQKVIKKAKGELGVDDWQKVANAINWDNLDIDFNDFMGMTQYQQSNYLANQIPETYEAQVKAINNSIEALQEDMLEYQKIADKVSTDEFARNDRIARNWELVTQARKDYLDYKQNVADGESVEEFDISKYNLDYDILNETLGETFDWEKVFDQSDTDFETAVENAAGDAKADVEIVLDARQKTSDIQDQIDSQFQGLTIATRVKVETQLSAIENSVDGIVSVFEAIEKGVEKTTNNAGKQVYGFSLDAARAIENIYPGFMASAELLRDGTFGLTEDMYNAFFNSSDGILRKDIDTKVKILQGDIEVLKAKKTSAEAALKIAEQLATGEITIGQLSEEQKQEILAAYVNHNEITNGKILDDQVENLTTMDENYIEFWSGVSIQSGEAADDMYTNIHNSIGLQLKDLETLRDAIYSIHLQYKNMYSGDDTIQEIKQLGGVQGVRTQKTVDTSSADNLIHSLVTETWAGVSKEALFGDKEVLDFQMNQWSKALGENIKEDMELQIRMIDAQIAADTVAISKLLGSIDGAYDKLGKASKSNASNQKYYTEKQKKELDEIIERYHLITREIENQNDVLEDVGNNISRTYGKNKLKNYERELKELTKQQENYNIKLKEAYAWEEYDRTKLESLFGKDSISYTDTGEIANYVELMVRTIEEYNAFDDQYQAFQKKYTETADKNAKSALEQEKALWEMRKTEADKEFQKRQEAIKKYEESLDVQQQMIDALEENARKMADNRLSQIEYKLEIVLDVKSMKDALREFDKKSQEIFNDYLTHGFGGLYRDSSGRQLFQGFNIEELSKDQAYAEAALYPDYKEQYEALVKEYELADNAVDRDRIIKDIMDLQGKVLDSAEAIVEWVNSIEDIVPKAVDAAAERFSLFTDQLEHNTTVVETIRELYALQGVTYKTMDGFNRLQGVAQEKLDAQVAQAKLQKKWYDEAKENLTTAQAALDSLNGDETDLRYDTYKKARDAYLEEFNKAQEAYLSLAKDAMETAQEMYLEQIEKAVYDFGQTVSNGVGLDLLQDKYDHYIEEDERYFDKINEQYQTLSWYNKLQEDIDKSTNQAQKERLRELQKEIDIRREGGTLSQYDLDILNAKYELLKAQAAFEDAQNAKNKIQLVRDRQGNWNYQYTNDPQQVEDTKQDLLDAQIDWYNIAKQQVTDVTGEIISTWQECQDKIKEIYSDMSLTDEERSARAQEIYRYYTEKIKFLEEEKQNAIDDMTQAGNFNLISNTKLAGDELVEDIGLTQEEIEAINSASWDEILKLITDKNASINGVINDTSKNVDLFENTYGKDLDKMTINTDKFEEQLTKTLDEADESFENFKDVVENVADETGTSLEELDDQVNEVSDSTDQLADSGLNAADALWDMIDQADEAARAYADMAQEIWGTVEALRALAAEQMSYVESQTPSRNDDENIKDYSYWLADQHFNKGQDISNSDKWDIRDQERNPNGASLTNSQLQKLFDKADAGDSGAKQVIQDVLASGGELKFHNLIKKYGVSLDTGGYTGEFSEGKLALLHQKELVLNQADTANMLSMIDAVRSMGPDFFASLEKIIDGGSVSALTLMAEKLAVNGVSTPGELEQNIHIDRVEFPNITSADGLKEAFASLVNDASQWARRR